MKRAGPTVHMMPRRICASCRLRKRFAVVLAPSASAKTWRKCGAISLPKSVMRQLALAPQQQTAEFLLELLNGTRQCRL